MSAAMTGWAEALLASLWQAPIIAAAAWLLEQGWAARASTRHAIRAVALMMVPGAVLATAWGWLPALGQLAQTMAPGGASTAIPSTAAPWVSAVVFGWATGVLLMSLRAAGQWRRVERLRRSAWPLPQPWPERVRTMAAALGIEPPALGLSPACDGPLVLGVLRPMVLLPAGLLGGVEPAVVEAALAHELAHLRRLDPWLHVMQSAVEIVLFFNPAVWWLSWRMSEEREHACDEAAVKLLQRPPLGYARALVELEQWCGRAPPALALGLGGAGLRERVGRLVRPRRLGAARRWGARLALLTLGAVLVAWVAAPEPSPPPIEAPQTFAPSWLPRSVLQHEPAIVEAAARHGIDPSLLAIMVWAESRGRTDARSPVGARGLLQLMPSTAAEIAQQRGLPTHAPARLDEPAYNLDLGAWYLARQLERYGDLSLALAAYNAGPGRVAAYERGEAELPEQTRRYQATILALWRERWLPWSPTLSSRAAQNE